jgi:hypothetical protein
MKRRLAFEEFLCRLKYYAVEIAATLMFIVWLAKTVWRELGL